MNGNLAVQRVITYISEHYEEHLTIEMIAKEASFSTSECCRVFKRVTGETIFAYLQSYRLSKGMELLSNTKLSISQIAMRSDFVRPVTLLRCSGRVLG